MEKMELDKAQVNERVNFFDRSELVEKIIYCKSEGKFTRFYMTDGTSCLISRGLEKVQELLPKLFFFRINNSYLINCKYMKGATTGEKRNAFLPDPA